MHSLYLAETNPSFRSFYFLPGTTIADGFPVLVAARFPKPPELAARVGTLDWVRKVELTPEQTLMLIGGTENASKRAAEALRMSTEAHVVAVAGSNWNDRAEKSVLQYLNQVRPDIVLVGLGMPLQEEFLLRNLGSLPRAVYATVGGAIDQLAGIQRPAPRWLGKLGLEWLWRLASNPGRLAKRYLVEPLQLVLLLSRRRGLSQQGDANV